jgi:hypothetical protein
LLTKVVIDPTGAELAQFNIASTCHDVFELVCLTSHLGNTP